MPPGNRNGKQHGNNEIHIEIKQREEISFVECEIAAEVAVKIEPGFEKRQGEIYAL